MMRQLLTAAALSAASSMAAAGDQPIFSLIDRVIVTPETVTIIDDSGGNIHDYVSFIEANKFAIRVEGTCKSSCTMFLTAKRICVSPDAIFGFHGPSSDEHGEDAAYMQGLVDKIAAHQPEPIGARFKADWSKSRDMSWVTGAEIMALAPEVPACAEHDDE